MKHWPLTPTKAKARTDIRIGIRLSASISTRLGTTSLSAGKWAAVRRAKNLSRARAQRGRH